MYAYLQTEEVEYSYISMKNLAYKILLLMCLLCFGKETNPQTAGNSNSEKYWIFLTDKNSDISMMKRNKAAAEKLGISQRALKRRYKMKTETCLLDQKDLPVSTSYRNALEDMGVSICFESRWLNAVSGFIPEHQADKVLNLPFVRKIQLMGKLKLPSPKAADENLPKLYKTTNHSFDYGQSLIQNSQIHIPEVHNLGFSGKGILIGILDTGFKYDHPLFSKMDIVAEYDFHQQDSVTSNQAGDHRNQHNHGTQTLSIIGGFLEGKLIGPAWGASYALGKTEWLPTETRLEEDRWVAGIEWLERMGADVVSSSLGYYTYDDGTGYTYDDLDGNTCITTIAADRAASLGVVVVTSAGNQRDDPWYYIISPADGDSVIAVGAVTSNNTISYFSSPGPTADGRIKPDVVALGTNNYALGPSDENTMQYYYVSGTSFSCPLVAGVCALILEAHPELNPIEVRDAVRNTASQAGEPDNDFGWGLVDAYQALFYHGMIFRNFQNISFPQSFRYHVELDILSKSGIQAESVYFSFRQSDDSFADIPMTLVLASNKTRFSVQLPEYADPNSIQFYISATDTIGQTFKGPIHAPEQLYSFSQEDSSAIPISVEKQSAFHVYPNYPNPFRDRTTIAFDLQTESNVTVQIFNVVGQLVTVLLNDVPLQGESKIIWDGLNTMRRKAPSGVYLCVLKTKHKTVSQKMILIR